MVREREWRRVSGEEQTVVSKGLKVEGGPGRRVDVEKLKYEVTVRVRTKGKTRMHGSQDVKGPVRLR